MEEEQDWQAEILTMGPTEFALFVRWLWTGHGPEPVDKWTRRTNKSDRNMATYQARYARKRKRIAEREIEEQDK